MKEMNRSYGRRRGDLSGAKFCGRVETSGGTKWTGWHREMEGVDAEVAGRFPGAVKVGDGLFRFEEEEPGKEA